MFIPLQKEICAFQQYIFYSRFLLVAAGLCSFSSIKYVFFYHFILSTNKMKLA